MWEGVKLSWVITTSEKELVEQKVAVMFAQGLPWFPIIMKMGLRIARQFSALLDVSGFCGFFRVYISRLHFCL